MLLFIYDISFFNKTIFLQTTSKWTSYAITNIYEFFTSHITSFINSTTLTESASILEKANHILHKSFNEAPIWYTYFWSIMINRSWAFVKTTPLKLRSEEHTSELQSRPHLVCRLLLEKKKKY